MNINREELLKKSKEDLIDYFIDIIQKLNTRITELEKENKELKAKLNIPKKDSKNSSKPPSSDYKGNKETTKKTKKKKGPPFGHKAHHKKLSEKPDKTINYDLEYCPDCGLPLYSNSKNYTSRQYIELQKINLSIVEEKRQFTTCPNCKKTVYAEVSNSGSPPPRQYLGSYLKSFLVLLYYRFGVSLGKLQDFINTFSNNHLSSGVISKAMYEMTDLLKSFHDNLKSEVITSDLICADETGWRVNGETQWAWVFQNDFLTFYIIKPSRGSNVPEEVLGNDFNGILISDFYSSYNPIKSSKKGKCCQHLIRDLRYGADKEDDNGFCHKMLDILLDALFLRKLKEQFPYLSYKVETNLIHRRIDKQLKRKDFTTEGKRLCKRILKYYDDIFLFLHDLEVPPTNNSSEQAIRKLVIHRKRSNGSRSDKGALGMSRIMSVIETCKKRSLNIVEKIYNTFQKSSSDSILLDGG
jgi:hypothetical protein